jgi:hypothetical protein
MTIDVRLDRTHQVRDGNNRADDFFSCRFFVLSSFYGPVKTIMTGGMRRPELQ